jgi:hypothetical protein
MTMINSANFFLRILLLKFTIFLYTVLIYLLLTRDAVSTWTLRSKIYLVMLVLLVVIGRLERNAWRRSAV